MFNTAITYLQVFGIGFTFGFAGPCFMVCTPILLTYIVGRQDKTREALADIVLFLFGRLCAYIILGAAAGLSGYYLRRLAESGMAAYLNMASGVISIILGIIIFFHKQGSACAHKRSYNKIYDFGSILALGFLIGISPCAPLTALLLEIALMSKNIFEGAAYAFSFGLGTFAAGLIVVAGAAGILKGFARKLIHSEAANKIFKSLCAALLILFGVTIIIGNVRFQ